APAGPSSHLRAALERAAAPPRRVAWRTVAPPAAAAALLGAVAVFALRERGLSAEERIFRQEALVDSLELDAASLRLRLATESADPGTRASLDARVGELLRRIEKLRREGLPERQGG